MKKWIWFGIFTSLIIAGGIVFLNYYFEDSDIKIDFEDELKGD